MKPTTSSTLTSHPQPHEARPSAATRQPNFVRGLGEWLLDWRECTQTAIPIGPTHPERAYITAQYALNLQMDEPGGDWHPACWHLGHDLPPAAENPGTTPTLGRDGLLDVRRYLRELRHPAAFRPIPVWGAAYWRAIVDWAASTVRHVATERGPITTWQGDEPRYADLWFVADAQHERILDACRRLAGAQQAYEHVWNLWLEMIIRERIICNGERPC